MASGESPQTAVADSDLRNVLVGERELWRDMESTFLNQLETLPARLEVREIVTETTQHLLGRVGDDRTSGNGRARPA